MSTEVWAAILDAIPDVEAWNRNLGELKRLAAENGPECKRFIAEEAEKRGYLWSPGSKCYVHPWSMYAVSGKNIIGVGWKAGTLAVVFASKDGPRRYESVESNVPREVMDKILRVPYPDKLYAQLVKDKIPMQRVV